MVLGLASLPTVVGAADGTWIYNSNSNTQNWSNTADWSGGIVADGGGLANFSTLNISGARAIAVDTTSRTVRRLDIGDTDNTHSYTISASGGASLIFDNTANSANAQLNETSGSKGDTISAPLSLNSSLDITNASPNTLLLSGGITAGTTGTKTITTSTGLVSISGIGTGTGTVAVVQNGSGTLTLSGTNTYTGGVTINGGTVVAGSTTALGAATAATLTFGSGSTGKFQLSGKGATIIGLSTGSTVGTPVIENASSTASTFTVNAANSSAFAGTIQDGTGGGALALTMGGAGSLTLSGSNSYSGLTTVSAGTLTISGTNSSAGAVTVSGGILQLNNSSNGGLASGTLTFGNGSVQAINADRALSNNVSFTASTGTTISGAQNITLNGSFTQSANSRTLTSSITGGNTLALAGNVYLSDTSGPTARVMTVNGTGVTKISGVIADYQGTSTVANGLAYTGSSTLTLTNTNTYTGSTSISGGGTISVSTIGNSGASGNVGAGTTINLGSTTTNGTLLYTGTTDETTSKVINLQSASTGGGVLDQSGTGALKFTADFTSSGAYSKTITLQGSTAGTGEIAGKIVDNSTGNKTSVLKQGTGTWTLSGANIYTGTTMISGGTLQLGSGSTTGSLATTSVITDNANLTINRSNTVTQGTDFSGSAINGSGSFTQAGAGTTTLNAANTYTGTTTISGGTLAVASSASTGTGNVSVNNGGTLGGMGTIAGATTVNSGGTITGGSLGTTAGTVGTLNLSSTLTINGTYVALVSGAGSDMLNITGAVDGTEVVSFVVGQALTASSYVLATYVSITGMFTSSNTPAGYQLDQSATRLTLDMTDVPEPGTWVGGFLLLGTVAYSQRRRLARLVGMVNAA